MRWQWPPPSKFTEAILIRGVRADYGREHDLASIAEATAQGLLWSLIEGGAGIEEAE